MLIKIMQYISEYNNSHKHRNSIGFGSVHAMRSCVKRCDYIIEEELFFELSVGQERSNHQIDQSVQCTSREYPQ